MFVDEFRSNMFLGPQMRLDSSRPGTGARSCSLAHSPGCFVFRGIQNGVAFENFALKLSAGSIQPPVARESLGKQCL